MAGTLHALIVQCCGIFSGVRAVQSQAWVSWLLRWSPGVLSCCVPSRGGVLWPGVEMDTRALARETVPS